MRTRVNGNRRPDRGGDRRDTHSRRGVTLIEVLLALAIMVMALTAIAGLVDFGTDRALDTQLQSRGTRLALSKMAEVEAGIVSPDNGPAQGDFSAEGEPDWTWSVDPKAELVSGSTTTLYTVTVTVSRTIAGQKHDFTLTQQMLSPTLVGSAAQAEQAQGEATTTDPSTGTTP